MSFPAPPLLQADQILADMPTMGNAMNLHIVLTARIRRTAPPHPALLAVVVYPAHPGPQASAVAVTMDGGTAVIPQDAR